MSERAELLRIFAAAPPKARAHVAVRWQLFPFSALLPLVPQTGQALDLGCGHGLWSFYMSAARPALQILGLDLDEEKIALAQALAERRQLRNLRFLVSPAESAPLPSCDLVSLIDVLYLIPYPQQERLLTLLAERLRPGGRLLVKEMSERPRWKAGWNRLQETLSVRLFHFSRGRDFYFRRQEEWRELLTGLGLAVRLVPLDRGYLHPHILFVAERR